MNINKFCFHICHFEEFYNIISTGKLTKNTVNEEHKCLNEQQFSCTWFSPNVFGGLGSFYGNMAFCVDFHQKIWLNESFRIYFLEKKIYNEDTIAYRYVFSENDLTGLCNLSEIARKDVNKNSGVCKWWLGDDNQICIKNPSGTNKKAIIEFMVEKQFYLIDCEYIMFLKHHDEKCIKKFNNPNEKCVHSGLMHYKAQIEVVFRILLNNIKFNKKFLRLRDSSENDTLYILKEVLDNTPSRYPKMFTGTLKANSDNAKDVVYSVLNSYLQGDDEAVEGHISQFSSLKEFDLIYYSLFEEHFDLKIRY